MMDVSERVEQDKDRDMITEIGIMEVIGGLVKAISTIEI